MTLQYMPFKPLEDDDKFKELILFVCRRSEGDGPFGAIKLNKLLFFSDFMAYRKFGQPITGHRYQKLKKGPAPRALLPIQGQLIASHAAALAQRDYHGHVQKRLLALRDADLSKFTSDEVALVTELIEEFWGKSATQMSELSHEFRGWQLAEENEDIPYEVSLVDFERESPNDLNISDDLLAELNQLKQQCG